MVACSRGPAYSSLTVLGVPLQCRRGDVDENEFADQVGCHRGQPYRSQPAQRHADHEFGTRRKLA